VVVGRSFDRGNYYSDAIIVRLNQDGSLDSSFGNSKVLEANGKDEVSQF